MTTKLEPVDYKRCQGETVQKAPFACGGTHRRTRCNNAPSVVATEAQPGPDNQCGSMSLCTICKAAMVKALGAAFATFESIPCQHLWPEKDGQTDINGSCELCNMSFMYHIHVECP
jgi:hypothetical protein